MFLVFIVNEEGYSFLYVMDIGDYSVSRVEDVFVGFIFGLNWYL